MAFAEHTDMEAKEAEEFLFKLYTDIFDANVSSSQCDTTTPHEDMPYLMNLARDSQRTHFSDHSETTWQRLSEEMLQHFAVEVCHALYHCRYGS
jgi:uncharacterized SAM-binding protein YcdF (DUF218 family)